jgi:hypothetical protein
LWKCFGEAVCNLIISQNKMDIQKTSLLGHRQNDNPL